MGGPNSVAVETILSQTDLRSAYPDAHQGEYVPTNYDGTQVLDYIFYRELELLSANIIGREQGASDHLALIASFQFFS